ncbi:MAG: VWA domain-containing protein [candidate division WS1 bacterium]|nr:VWA domain-containing protein [candidate division WS1 bacterium]
MEKVTPTRRLLPVVLGVLLLATVGAAWSSQGPAHVYFALAALDQASPAVRAIVDPNLEAYLAGAVGPDIALTVYWGQLAMGRAAPGEEAHYERSGKLINNMYSLAANDQERAFVLGWLTHWQTDCIIHPLVNRFGGYYKDDEIRHKHLEMFECAHVFNKWAGTGPLTNYVTNPAMVPARLINAAYAQTYPPGWTTGRFKDNPPKYLGEYETKINEHGVPVRELKTPPAFEVGLPSSAENMRIISQAFVDVQNTDTFSGIWASGSMYLAVKGPPPTKKEYKSLMEPIVIDKVEWEKPDRARGETTGNITITYTINDVRIFKAFADAWDSARPTVISSIASRINGLVAAPTTYTVPDWDLDEGPGGYDESIRAHTWPGFPDIKDLLVHVAIVDKKGDPVVVTGPDGITAWEPTGEWVPCPPAEPQTWGQWIGWSKQEGTKAKVWGGLAGQASLKIPVEVDISDAEPLVAELKLEFADRSDKSPYGIEAVWNGTLGPEEPELSICFLVDCSGSMGGSKIREAIAAVKQSVAATNDGKTEWALVRFGACNASVVCQFTMEAGKLQAAADRLSASGDTPLTYGIAKAVDYLVTKGRGHTGRLILLADGEDNCRERGSKGPDEASGEFRPMFIHSRDIDLLPTLPNIGVSGGAR